MIVQAYDVGGTWIRAAKFIDGKMKKKVKERTDYDFIQHIRSLSKKLGEADVLSLAFPGPVEEGILLSAPPLGLKKSLDIRKEFSSLEKRIVVDNDLNAAVLAELHDGYGKQWNNFYLLTISTGIGVGIVLDGKVRNGGEFGHCEINMEKKRACFCGRMNCWCAYSSGKGIEGALIYDLGIKVSADEVFKTDTQTLICDDPVALRKRETIKETLNYAQIANAKGLALMINALQVEGIVIMGSIGRKQFKEMIPSRRALQHYTLNSIPPIVKTRLGEDIGLLGAYYQALS